MTAPLPTRYRVGFDGAQEAIRAMGRRLVEPSPYPACMACAAVGMAILAVVVGAAVIPEILRIVR